MLKGLEVENFAIIDSLNLEFSEGLNIFTGETGAGKTIIIEALSMALGEKVSPEAVRTGEEKARVSALFEVPKELRALLKDITGSDGGEILFQRDIGTGRSSCYINGKMATLSAVKEAGSMLVDIHGQHEHQSILNTARHIDLLDRFGGIYERQGEFGRKYVELRQKEKRFGELSLLEKEGEKARELLQFQVDEIKNAGLKEGEEAEIEKERLLLSNSQKISEALAQAFQGLHEEEGAAAERIRKASLLLRSVQEADPETGKLADALDEAGAIVSDAASGIRMRRDCVQHDPGRLEELTDRQYLIGKLKKKYGQAIPDILKYADETGKKLKEITSCRDESEKLSGEIKKLRAGLMKEAGELSEKRSSAARRLEKKVVDELSELEMKKTLFKADVRPRKSDAQPTSSQVYKLTSEELGPKGINDVEFLISPNPGEDLRPLSKIASGGEASRIMLALKSILADADEIPVLVFDEIDSGIGGKTASSVGEKLEKLARSKQILCITHLPQIAACGSLHFKVEKTVEKQRTKTSVKELGKEERIEEIARMVSGEKITPTSLKHARELLES